LDDRRAVSRRISSRLRRALYRRQGPKLDRDRSEDEWPI